MARSRAYRRHQAARARARTYRIARLWHSDKSAREFADFVAARPAWFGVCVSTHCRPCSCACCFGSHYRQWCPDRQSLRARDAFHDSLDEIGLP